MKHTLFAYGTLQLPEKLQQIIGRTVNAEPAVLKGYRCGLVARANFPGIVASKQGQVEGMVLFNLGFKDFQLLDHYEGELYQRVMVSVLHNETPTQCWAYTIVPWAHSRVTDKPWSIDWYRMHGAKGRLTYRS